MSSGNRNLVGNLVRSVLCGLVRLLRSYKISVLTETKLKQGKQVFEGGNEVKPAILKVAGMMLQFRLCSQPHFTRLA